MPPRHDQLPGLVQIASRDRMTDCLSEIPVRLMPGPSAAVKDGGEPWLGPVKLVTQQVTKQMVIPVPVAPGVQPDQEQVDRSISSRMRWAPSHPATASHSGPDNRSSTEVR